MKIAFYCQHVLGIGHVHRSLEICRALSVEHQVTMITGGGPLDQDEQGFSFFQLPGLMMDATFNNLAPCDPARSLEQVKSERKRLLMDFFRKWQPDVFLIELYPFGRKSFRFELDPVLEACHQGLLSPCKVFCSLRDILVERDDQKKFEARIIHTLNIYFSGLLIHGDEKLIGLGETFGRIGDISVPIAYTGYVTPPGASGARDDIRKKLGITSEQKLIVGSIGSGSVGVELLTSLLHSFEQLNDPQLRLQIFSGPYLPQEEFHRLAEHNCENIAIERFSPQFIDWLLAADLSVSMAGYNTTMNVLACGVPALMLPFGQNREQKMRLDKLSTIAPVTILHPDQLEPDLLSELLTTQLEKRRYSPPIDLHGARKTRSILAKWCS